MCPCTTGAADSPMYPALAATPGSREISVIGSVSGKPGTAPGTLTNASLASIEARYRP